MPLLLLQCRCCCNIADTQRLTYRYYSVEKTNHQGARGTRHHASNLLRPQVLDGSEGDPLRPEARQHPVRRWPSAHIGLWPGQDHERREYDGADIARCRHLLVPTARVLRKEQATSIDHVQCMTQPTTHCKQRIESLGHCTDIALALVIDAHNAIATM
jgi:hypothetical protein